MPDNYKFDFTSAPDGMVHVPLETNEDDITLSGIDRHNVMNHKFSATTLKVKMVLIDEKDVPVVKLHIQGIKNECKKQERLSRCSIRSPKTGRLVFCPDCISCYGDKCMKRVDPSRVCEPVTHISYEEYIENGGELGCGDTTSGQAIDRVDNDLFVKRLRMEDERLATIYLKERQGYSTREIRSLLNIKKSRYSELRRHMLELWKEFFL